MSQRKLSEQKMQEIRELAAGWGKVIARRAFGEDGPDSSIDFWAMEQVASVAARALTEGTLDSLLEQQAHALEAQQPCPACGCLCPVSFDDRPLVVQGGRLTLHEPVCHCPDCRRDFFPPTALPASWRLRLQPLHPLENRQSRWQTPVLR